MAAHPWTGGFLQKVGAAQSPEDDEEMEAMILFFAFIVIFNILFLVGGCVFTCCYFKKYIKPTADKWARRETIVPEDLRTGSWAFGLFDCFSECEICLCAWCCPLCVMSENWYRAGWSQGFLGVQEPKKAFFGGCLAILCISQLCGSCVVCAFAALRGGFTDHPGGFGGAVPMNTRFGIKTNFFESCCSWLCCQICVLTQEHRQIMKLVNHPQTVTSPAQQMATMVGYPAQVMMVNPGGQVAAPITQGQVVQGVILPPAQPGQSFDAAQPFLNSS